MTDEILFRDRVEIERRRDEERKLDRINAIEKAHAILQTLFDAALRRLGCTEEEIKRLGPQWAKELSEAMATVDSSMKSANDQQSKDLLGEMRSMITAMREAAKDEQIENNAALLAAIRERRSRWVWWALGIVGSLIVMAAGTVFGIYMAGLMEHRP